MPKPGSTHVIEIETGIGEPAFIPLTLGSELQPISVGKKGMWRIESARVLDVHAFVYFDGTSLFLQSADESQAASVDGYRVGKAWTELHAPCMIEIGASRLRFRSLADPPPAEAPPPPPAPVRPAAGAPPKESSENTKIGPIESRPVGAVALGPSNETRMEGTGGGSRGPRATGQLLAGGVAPVQAIPASMHPPGLMNPMMSPSGAYGPPPTPYPQHMGGPHASASVGAVNMHPGMQMGPLPSGSMSLGGPMGSGSYGSMNSRAAPTVQTAGPSGGGDDLLSKYKELPPTKRILVLMSPFCLIAAAYLLLFDDEVPVDEPPGAATTEVSATRPPSVVPAANGQVPQCGPGFVPYTVPVNGSIPCVPLGTPMPPGSNPVPAPAPAPAPLSAPGPGPSAAPVPQPAPAPAPAPAPVAGNPKTTVEKTLERQAVDAVAVNDFLRAAAIYDSLYAQSNPKNPVYFEAARILRQKAAAGQGAPQ